MRLDLKVFLGTYVVIDRAFVSNQEANVGSTQTVGFHAEWVQNGSDVTAGVVTVQNMITFQNGQYVLNATGWITFNVASPTVQEQEWDVAGVNINGSTVYEQTAPNPSIIWNRIMIVDGGPTKESISPGETVTVWFKAIYEYDNSTFDNSDGSSLYLNGSAMSWSQPNDRWEQNFTATTLGTDTFVITGFNDSLHGITAINLTAGTETITVSDKPAPASPLLYAILAAFIIVAISVAVFFTRRRGNRLKVTKEAEKKKHPARANKHKN